MQCSLGDPDSGMLNLKAHRLALAITKKMLDENHFKTVEKTLDRTPLSFKIGDRVYFKKSSPASGISSGDLDTELSKLSMTDIFCILKTRPQENYDLAM